MPLTPPELPGLADWIYQSLRRAIMTGEFAPEERLVELDIARQMNTSQGPVREALKQLEGEGLVVRHKNRGTFVSPLPQKDTLSELYQLRSAAEELAAKRLIERATEAEMDLLQEQVDRMRELARQQDLPAYFDADMAFHDMVFQLCGHDLLQRVWAVIVIQLRRLLPITRDIYATHIAEIAEEHQPLVDAVRARDYATWLQCWHDRHMYFVWRHLVPEPWEQKPGEGGQ